MTERTEEITKSELIEQIIAEEYRMFSRVENIGERASCQDDFHTFHIMRFAQHNIFGMNTLNSYLADIEAARRAGRNLIAEKYSWMMEETDPAYFAEKLKPYLLEISGRKMRLVDSMTTTLMRCYESIRQRYPDLLAAGRNPYENGAGVSIRLYFSGELKTWSENTLCLGCQDIIGLLEKHHNPVGMIYEKIMDLYGYSMAETAEEIK